MAFKHLAGVLDGGSHGDPREAEFEELLNDGEEEEGSGTGVHNDKEDWGEEEFSEKGVTEKGKAKSKEAEEEEAVEEEEKEEPKKKEEAEEEEPEKEVEEKEEKAGDREVKEEEKEDPKTKYQKIPYDRFKKELLKRKELALRAVQAEERARALEARMAAFEKAAGKASDPEPDRNADPFAHQEWRIRQLELQNAAKVPEAPKPRSQEFQNAVFNIYKDSADEFRAEHPDFNEAYTFAIGKTAEQIARQYPGATQEQITAAIRELEMGEVSNSLKNGIDPAERVYEIAKSMGFKVKEGDSKGQGKADRIVEALATETARKKASSLASKGNGSGRKPLTIDDVEDMSNEELERFMDRNSGRSNPLKP